MKYPLDFLRMVFISVEFVFALATYIFCNFYPKIFSVLGDSITNDSEITKWLPVIPLGLSAYCCVDLTWKMITPLSSSNKELYDRPEGWRVKMRWYFSLFLSLVCAAIAIALWIFSKALSHGQIGGLFILALGLSLINTGCMIFASIALRTIMEKDDKD